MFSTDYVTMILQLTGGLGIFLLGMVIMTEGLRELAGKAIRSALMRFGSSPASGALTGAISTAILQSSSATTVAVVGFVGAGLMTFNASLGIILGANIGTTITGWLVALLGFKLQLGMLLLPLVLVGAILRLFFSGRLASAGYALAGFGLIFVGIDAMQQGMADMQGVFTPGTLPPDTWTGRILIVLLGAVATMITQSSSAGVAAVMTALSAGAVSIEQGLALIIGMDIGTTITAVLATIGGTTAARRTGISHMVYNLITGCGALLLITPYLLVWRHFGPEELTTQAAIALVAFHTLFNVTGVLLILPFINQFARLIRQLIPESASPYAFEFDRRLLRTPALALTVIQETVQVQFVLLLNHIDAIVTTGHEEKRTDLARAQAALDETREYLDAIHLRGATDAGWERMIALVHVLDHMQRLHERCEEDEDRAITARESETLAEMHGMLASLVSANLDSVAQADWAGIVQLSGQTDLAMAQRGDPQRDLIAASVVNGNMSVPDATDCLAAIRWLERVAHHIARIDYHLHNALLASGK